MAAAAASGESGFKKGIDYQELEESVLQFILDCCESSISKYNKFLQVCRIFFYLPQFNFFFLKKLFMIIKRVV